VAHDWFDKLALTPNFFALPAQFHRQRRPPET
jgi:hypothetical protein